MKVHRNDSSKQNQQQQQQWMDRVRLGFFVSARVRIGKQMTHIYTNYYGENNCAAALPKQTIHFHPATTILLSASSKNRADLEAECLPLTSAVGGSIEAQ